MSNRKLTHRAMVVLSGGQDSTTCLLDARSKYTEVNAITFDYGQRHRREIECAKQIGVLLGVKTHTVVNVAGLLKSSSPLVDPAAQLETYTDADSMAATIGNRIELTFVPLRNPLFLLIAANHAIAAGCNVLITGVCQSDNANYPDCTAEFVQSMEDMVNEALGLNRPGHGDGFIIEAPLLHFSKADTVRLAGEHDELGYRALALTHTCYAGEYPPCGVCHACVLRATGFAESGYTDPLIIESHRNR